MGEANFYYFTCLKVVGDLVLKIKLLISV